VLEGECFDVLLYRRMTCLPAVHRAWWTHALSVNELATFGKPAS